MKTQLTTLIFLILTIVAYSKPTEVSYGYNASGNRISRTVVMLKSLKTPPASIAQNAIADSAKEEKAIVDK